MSWGEDVYSNPAKHGLQLLGEVELDDESYSFHLFVAWTDGVHVYYGTDSGCSCPSPFETYGSKDSLSVAYSFDEFSRALSDAVSSGSNPNHGSAGALKHRAKQYFPKLFEAARKAIA